jgi:hypothetical protein
MKAELVSSGHITVEGEKYAHDIVIKGGRIARRDKGPSKGTKGKYGHTPLTAAEAIPWGGKRLIVGTGTSGRLSIAPDVYAEAERRGIEIVALPTREACLLLADLDPRDVFAILHATC